MRIDTALEPPRLVIVDFFLRPMSGQDVLRRLRVSRRGRNIPVLFLSSSDLGAAHFTPWSAAGTLRRPVAIGELLATVATILATGLT